MIFVQILYCGLAFKKRNLDVSDYTEQCLPKILYKSEYKCMHEAKLSYID
jgi:hypothetical protein